MNLERQPSNTAAGLQDKSMATATPTERPHAPRILVSIDHEDDATMEFASEVAIALHAHLRVLFVVNPLCATTPKTSIHPQDVISARRTRGKAILERLCARFPRADAEFREGSPPTEIAAAARAWHATMIMIGTHRRGGLGRFFLDGTSAAVLRKTDCPVLLVPDLASSAHSSAPQETP
jgi:nucleotide-binding universal stress UspA family protein